MQTRDAVEGLHNFQESTQPPKFLDEVRETRKEYSINFIKYFSKIRANLKRPNRVYILSLKHT